MSAGGYTLDHLPMGGCRSAAEHQGHLDAGSTTCQNQRGLGPRLVAFTDVAVCDRYPGHEVTIVTDGTTAYAWGSVTDAGTVLRDGVTLTTTCGQPHGPGGEDADPCEGEVTWRLDAEGCWTADAEVLETLDRYGEQVER